MTPLPALLTLHAPSTGDDDDDVMAAIRESRARVADLEEQNNARRMDWKQYKECSMQGYGSLTVQHIGYRVNVQWVPNLPVSIASMIPNRTFTRRQRYRTCTGVLNWSSQVPR